MVDKINENLVLYLDSGKMPINRKKVGFFAAGHGYTYEIGVEGRRSLRKDTPTSNGYYTGNNQKANTVVNIKDIITVTAPRTQSTLHGLLLVYKNILELLLTKDANYKNLCVITKEAILGKIVKLTNNDLKKEKLVIDRRPIEPFEKEVIKDILKLNEQLDKNGHLVVLDFTQSVEGGMGNKECSKVLDIAMAETLYTKNTKLILDVTPRKEHEEPLTDLNRIITASRWYFTTTNKERHYETIDGYRAYSFGKVETDKKYHGKITPDVTYSKIFTKTPITLLDKLFEYSATHIKNEDGLLLAGSLDYINSKETRRLIDRLPGYSDGKMIISPNKRHDANMVLVELIDPVLLSYRVREHIDALDIIYNSFQKRGEDNKHGNLKFYEITDEIYDKTPNAKGVVKLKLVKDFNQAKVNIVTKVEHPNAKKPVRIMLGVGYDLPSRNALNSVTDNDVKVWVGVDTTNKIGLRYVSLVETEEFIYIHTSAAANLRILALSEIKEEVKYLLEQ